jgi:hypothetical protein
MVEEGVEKQEVPQEVGVQKPDRPSAEKANDLIRKLDAVGWGLFLIWLGIVLLAKAQTSVALLGIGIIMLGVQLARMALKLRLEGFWFVAGLLFIVGALWQLADTRIPLVPILLIAAGLALVLTRFIPWQRKKEG